MVIGDGIMKLKGTGSAGQQRIVFFGNPAANGLRENRLVNK
jgi:hypothetical protein